MSNIQVLSSETKLFTGIPTQDGRKDKWKETIIYECFGQRYKEEYFIKWSHIEWNYIVHCFFQVMRDKGSSYERYKLIVNVRGNITEENKIQIRGKDISRVVSAMNHYDVQNDVKVRFLSMNFEPCNW